MRVAVLTDGLIPYPTGFGSAIHVWSLMETLLQRGHEVHLCCYGIDPSMSQTPGHESDYRNRIGKLTDLGVQVHLIYRHARTAASAWNGRVNLVRKASKPDPSDFYAGPAYKQELSRLLENLAPDALCAWTVDAVAATAKPFYPQIPRLAFLTDLDHLARRYRRRYRPARSLKGRIYQLADTLADRRLPSLIVALLADCEAVVDHAAHHCEWMGKQGVSQAKYLPVPVLDRAGQEWLAARKRALSRHKVPRITLIGNVTGIATYPGLSLLAQEILPEIEQRCGGDEYEVHIIGGGTLPADLAKALTKPCIKRRGYVENIHEEFRASDILLVPTPIDLGFRVRIAEGFSFGCCVVAHRANALGMPELRDGENALMADTGKGLAEAVVRCLRSPALRDQLGAAARATFEQVLDGRKICNQMVDELEFLASRSRSGRTPKASEATVLERVS